MFTKKSLKKKKKQEEKLGTKTRTQQSAAVCTSVTLNTPDTADCADTRTRSMKKNTLMIKTTTLNGELH